MENRGLKGLGVIAKLKDDWDSYGSPPVTEAAINTARRLMEPRVIPISGGGVQLEWAEPNYDVEIEIGPDGDIAGSLIELGKL